MVAKHNRVRLPPSSLKRWRRFVTYTPGVYLDLIRAMRDAARALIFAAQWPMLRDVAVRDMDSSTARCCRRRRPPRRTRSTPTRSTRVDIEGRTRRVP